MRGWMKLVMCMVMLDAVVGWSIIAPMSPHGACNLRDAGVRKTFLVSARPSTKARFACPRCSLYADQEKVIISRGLLEETIMPPPTPLEAAKRGSAAGAGGGGFGAAAPSKKGISKQHQAEAKVLAKELRREGVVRIDNVLSDDTADALRAYVMNLRKTSTDEVESGKVAPLQR